MKRASTEIVLDRIIGPFVDDAIHEPSTVRSQSTKKKAATQDDLGEATAKQPRTETVQCTIIGEFIDNVMTGESESRYFVPQAKPAARKKTKNSRRATKSGNLDSSKGSRDRRKSRH